jgi:Tfp pilus assembly protein PilX
MIRTSVFRSRPQPPRPASTSRRRLALADERGDTLIEVLISAVLLVLVVVATFNGLDGANRATALDRAHSQADALAQEDEDQLRSEPVTKLSELSRKRTVTENGTTFTIVSTSQYKSDATATASCSSTSPEASYLQTVSTVTWPSMGAAKPVVETSIISPPPDSALIVQVTESGTALPGAKVSATGPTPTTLETSADGCAILAVLPGAYELNVSKSGYVDQNGYLNSDEDLSSTHSVYLPAETTAKEGYDFGLAGKLNVSFTTASKASEGDTFVAYNTGMTTYRPFGTLGTYSKIVESPTTIFPFPASSPYTVYAGTCEADLPPSSVIEKKEVNSSVIVPPGGIGSIEVTEPPINIEVMSGKSKASPGKPVENAIVTLTDTGCSTKHEMKTNAKGALPRPWAPFGKYSLCVTGGSSGLAANRKYTTTLTNNTVSGPSELNKVTNGQELSSEGAAVIYMESGAPASPGTLESGTTCP